MCIRDRHYIINIQGSSGVDCAYLVEKDEDLCIKILDRLKGSRKIPIEDVYKRQTFRIRDMIKIRYFCFICAAPRKMEW